MIALEKYGPESNTRYDLQPLTKIHLYSNLKFDVEGNGDIQYVYIFTAIAVMVLIIACTNFINLSTASSARRAKEVGGIKIIGSKRIQHAMTNLLLQYVYSRLAGYEDVNDAH
jgi:putative ABC transport system permease protein